VSTRRYVLPGEQTRWQVGDGQVTFDWRYDDGRDQLLALYEKGKDRQWNATDRLDWSLSVDPTSPESLDDCFVPILGSEIWHRMGESDQGMVRHHMAAWVYSQFLHGEQGALICASKIVQTVPDLDAKFYAATQVLDEARHVEVFSRYIREKLGLAYPVNDHLKALLNDVISDNRWDMTYLGMQVLIEGLGLAGFAMIRDYTKEPLSKALNSYVMQDEARHVAFGRLALRDFYPQLTAAERAEREEFVVHASYLLRDRFLAEEVWDNLGMDRRACVEYVRSSWVMQGFRKALFSRIVPTVKGIGLLGDKARRAFEDLGVLDFQDLDPDDLAAADERAAAGVDRRRAEEVDAAIRAGGEQ
jgi:hypothetical protein